MIVKIVIIKIVVKTVVKIAVKKGWKMRITPLGVNPKTLDPKY